MTVYVMHSAQPLTGPHCADTVGYHFDEKRTDHFHNQFEKHRGQHPGIVALSDDFVKEGNDILCIGGSGKFSLLFRGGGSR
jgi:hypothetical protein